MKAQVRSFKKEKVLQRRQTPSPNNVFREMSLPAPDLSPAHNLGHGVAPPTHAAALAAGGAAPGGRGRLGRRGRGQARCTSYSDFHK